jgi:type III secretion protein Q
MLPEGDLIYLPRLSAAGAAAASELAARLPFYFLAADRPFRLSMPGVSPPEPAPDWPRFGGTLDHQGFSLTLEPRLLPPLAAAHLAELEVSDLPPELRSILLSVLLQDIDGLVAGWHGSRPRWLPDGAVPDGLEHRLVIDHADSEEAGVAAILWLDDPALIRLSRLCRERPTHAVALDSLPIALDLLLDHEPFSLAALRDLKPGDIVLTDQAARFQEGGLDLIVRIGNVVRFRARGADGSYTLVAELDAIMDFPETGLATTLDDLEVPVEFLVAQISLPLSRLRELAEGQVLDLGFDATIAVSLRVNRQTIATGELVRIMERTGVRITDLRMARGS